MQPFLILLTLVEYYQHLNEKIKSLILKRLSGRLGNDFGEGLGFKLVTNDETQSNFCIPMQRWQYSSLENDKMNHVNICIDLELLPKEIFGKHFLSSGCASEFASSTTGFKIIKVNNLNKNEKFSGNFSKII